MTLDLEAELGQRVVRKGVLHDGECARSGAAEHAAVAPRSGSVHRVIAMLDAWSRVVVGRVRPPQPRRSRDLLKPVDRRERCTTRTSRPRCRPSGTRCPGCWRRSAGRRCPGGPVPTQSLPQEDWSARRWRWRLNVRASGLSTRFTSPIKSSKPAVPDVEEEFLVRDLGPRWVPVTGLGAAGVDGPLASEPW